MKKNGYIAIVLLFVCVLSLTISGCGSKIPTGKVTGKITLDGQPLEDGRLSFYVQGQRESFADIKNGEIVNATTLKPGDGIPIGSAKVSVFSQKVTGTETVKGDEDPTQSFTIEKKVSRIPAKYNDANKSGLTCEIKAGNNELSFELKSK